MLNTLINHRLFPGLISGGGIMHKVIVSIGMLVFLAFTLSGCSQEPGQVDTAPEETPPDPTVATIEIPCEIYFESSVGKVCFPHKLHLKMGCTKCHHEVHAEALDTPHPDYLTSSQANCQTCHDANPDTDANDRKCSGCHHSEPENISDETLSSKVVLHKSCWQCHKTATGAEASKGCSKCHLKKEKQSTNPVLK
jgi:hypothetical protein